MIFSYGSANVPRKFTTKGNNATRRKVAGKILEKGGKKVKLQIENRTRRDVSHSRSSKHQTIRRRVMLVEITVIKSRPDDSEETK